MHVMYTVAVTACVNAMSNPLPSESMHSWHHLYSIDNELTHHMHVALPLHAPF